MSRAEAAILAAAALGMTGCMKIYPDPELPDVNIDWSDSNCDEGTGDLSLVLTGIDDTTAHYEQTVACDAYKTTFKDVSRQRFHLVGQLLDTSGEIYSEAESDVDLRNGFDVSSYLYFGGFSNWRVGWVFDMGATCESLGADNVLAVLSLDGQDYSANEAPCELGRMFGSAPPGTYAVTVYATAPGNITTVAVSQPIDVDVPDAMRADFGTVTLTPCASTCPGPF
ncbi:MAG TPA: hypothetical protein VL326_37995 [Kofleriaceae bacterium]|nr:hypothetical protein [Kofleriaceae bacterium]